MSTCDILQGVSARLKHHPGPSARVLAWGLFTCLGCGEGRTALLPPPEACQFAGSERACRSTCGQGKQKCQDGRWSPCEVPPVTVACGASCGSGTRVCTNGAWTECNVTQLTGPHAFAATLRDFHASQTDFEPDVKGDQSDFGVVDSMLGSDGTPSYAHSGRTLTITSPASFAQWYHDVPGVNVAVPYEIPLSESTSQPGNYYFSGWDFFPLDNDPRGFGNEGGLHDYDFTLAATATFIYRGGERFSITADDDLWVFVNRRLVIDLGGLHESKLGEIHLDDQASRLEITPGHAYQIHLFFAERKQVSTDLTILTNIANLAPCP